MSFTNKCIKSLLIFSFVAISHYSYAQQKIKLTPTQGKTRIAYINLDQLQKDYPALKTNMEAITEQWASGQKEFNYSKEQEVKKLQQQLYNDSLQGGNKKAEIQLQGQRAMDSLANRWSKVQQNLVEKRTKDSQEFEKVITNAVLQVFREGAYTEIKTLKSGEAAVNGTDITSLVLQKLH